MTTKSHLTIVTPTVDDDGRLPDDPAHPNFDNAPRYLIDKPRTHELHHDAHDEFEKVTATAVFVADGITGTVVELGPWSLSPSDARELGASLRELATALEPVIG
ncbi:hypothetical protein P9209_03420 [Prescottella defluvii]|nr:hypothetical protein P9209_03420 [Prescottella defluvii]